MKIIHTETTNPNDIGNQWLRDQIYNGLDCVVTLEVLEEILPNLDPLTSATYAFSRALQGPVLEMRLRGTLVDKRRSNEVVADFYDKIDYLERQLNRIVLDGVGMPTFSWRSNPDVMNLFYNHLQIPTIRRQGRPTCDREALEKLRAYTVAKPIVAHIIALREISKKIDALQMGVDHDGRMRTSYNIAGTNTGRFSSSFSEFGTGGNFQNIEESLRSVFVADPGCKFAKFDAKSGESYIVGAIEWNLFKDGRYLDAVESGDVHTAVARMCWPSLPWTGELVRDKHIAEQPFYRHYTYRFMCKKLGHGSNYLGQPEELAEQTKLPVRIVAGFQPKYFGAFPGHTRWHIHVDNELRRSGKLVSFAGRKRWFFGRRSDPETLRGAIAFDPQGSLADIVNRAMLRVWMGRRAPYVVMFQDHDALTFMYPEEAEDTVVPILAAALPETIPLQHGRTMTIPYDCKTGWNKGDASADNPDGLRDYTGHDQRSRTPEVSILDRIIRR
jgi:DNA polymerase-1